MGSSTGNQRPVLIGEAPSRTSDPSRPFSGRSGARLDALAGRPIVETFELRNLLDEWPGRGEKGSAWDAALARERAAEISGGLVDRDVVLIGRRVGRAFGHGSAPYLTWAADGRGFRVAVFPHPSGIVRYWNDPAAVEIAAAFLRRLA